MEFLKTLLVIVALGLAPSGAIAATAGDSPSAEPLLQAAQLPAPDESDGMARCDLGGPHCTGGAVSAPPPAAPGVDFFFRFPPAARNAPAYFLELLERPPPASLR